MTETQGSVTRLLRRMKNDGDAEAQLMEIVYGKLRQLASGYMRRERQGHTFQTTDLVNEAYLRLVEQKDLDLQNRAHFFAIAARNMRRILVEHARGRMAEKRGGGVQKIPLDEELVYSSDRAQPLIELDEALERFEQLDPSTVRVIELRFFGGLTVPETALALGISDRTVKRRWKSGRAWLASQLGSGENNDTRAMGAS
jgi:RNA polymerase sigma factor (TIGR02999 family)